MRISTIREFRDHATRLMRDEQPLLVTRRGRLAGVFLPWTADTLPLDLKKELVLALSASIGRQLKKSNDSRPEAQHPHHSLQSTQGQANGNFPSVCRARPARPPE